MSIQQSDLVSLIKASLSDAVIEIEDTRRDGYHFVAKVVSSEFKGKSRIQQHQMVYKALGNIAGRGIHALSLETSTPLNK